MKTTAAPRLSLFGLPRLLGVRSLGVRSLGVRLLGVRLLGVRLLGVLGLSLLGLLADAVCAAPRPLAIGDFDRMRAVADPVCSRDGESILYTVAGADTEADERRSSIWMVSFDGALHLRLTGADYSATQPQFSPDGRYISFLAQRPSDTKPQLYVLDRRGGEPEALTHVTGSIDGYDWSPDGRRIVLSIAPGEQHEQGEAHGPLPIVIDQLHFKEDGEGYLTAADRTQLFLLTVADHHLDALTRDTHFDDRMPTWSPDGRTVAFFSNRRADLYRTGKREIYLIEPGGAEGGGGGKQAGDADRAADGKQAGNDGRAADGTQAAAGEPRLLGEIYAPNRLSLLWTRDGRHLVVGTGLAPQLYAYMQDHLAVIDVIDGRSRPLAATLDRALSSPSIASDGFIAAVLEDDGAELPVRISLDGGRIERLLDGRRSVSALCTGNGHVAVVASTDSTPPEIFALDGASLRKLSAHNDALMSEIALGEVDDIDFPSRDGTRVHGMVVKPLGYQPGRLYPTILWIHGGPNGQDSHGLSMEAYSPELERQWFAAHGYLALAVNYRGSSGRGLEYARAILADWGGKEVADLRAAVDYALRAKLADPRRLGVGGWSYGGILTDYLIASDTRFKAAIAGAGSANQIAMYGSDEYILQYNAELGPPWRAQDLWLKVSYPFLHADRIRTATLFMGGDKDFNVPIAGGEQMYEALRTLEVPTQLVIYPGQFHEITRPSFIRDKMQRFLDWYSRYLPAPDP